MNEFPQEEETFWKLKNEKKDGYLDWKWLRRSEEAAAALEKGNKPSHISFKEKKG